jgi:hypothetical protein
MEALERWLSKAELRHLAASAAQTDGVPNTTVPHIVVVQHFDLVVQHFDEELKRLVPTK